MVANGGNDELKKALLYQALKELSIEDTIELFLAKCEEAGGEVNPLEGVEVRRGTFCWLVKSKAALVKPE